MAYNRVRTPKFYIDAVLLARQWGAIADEGNGGEYFDLNPSKLKSIEWGTSEYDTTDANKSIYFENRYWGNSLSYLFILGHNFYSEDIINWLALKKDSPDEQAGNGLSHNINGWSKLEFEKNKGLDHDRVILSFIRDSEDAPNSSIVGCASMGWSYPMPHSPDLELTQGISNESIKTQTTKGGHTLTNAGYNQQPNWIRQPWTTGYTNTVTEGRTVFPVGRRSWNLKFSYINDADLFPSSYNSATGIFDWSGTDPDTEEEGIYYNIKDNFIDKVYHGTNGFQLPFIFQPDKDTEEYAICRINSDSVSFSQVANNVYDISLNIIEVW